MSAAKRQYLDLMYPDVFDEEEEYYQYLMYLIEEEEEYSKHNYEQSKQYILQQLTIKK